MRPDCAKRRPGPRPGGAELRATTPWGCRPSSGQGTPSGPGRQGTVGQRGQGFTVRPAAACASEFRIVRGHPGGRVHQEGFPSSLPLAFPVFPFPLLSIAPRFAFIACSLRVSPIQAMPPCIALLRPFFIHRVEPFSLRQEYAIGDIGRTPCPVPR